VKSKKSKKPQCDSNIAADINPPSGSPNPKREKTSPTITLKAISDNLRIQEAALRSILLSLLQDVDYWILDVDWFDKKVRASDYSIDHAGVLNIDFRLSAKLTGYDSDLEKLVGVDLTSEDLAQIRGLVKKICLLRQLLGVHSPIDYPEANGAKASVAEAKKNS